MIRSDKLSRRENLGLQEPDVFGSGRRWYCGSGAPQPCNTTGPWRHLPQITTTVWSRRLRRSSRERNHHGIDSRRTVQSLARCAQASYRNRRHWPHGLHRRGSVDVLFALRSTCRRCALAPHPIDSDRRPLPLHEPAPNPRLALRSEGLADDFANSASTIQEAWRTHRQRDPLRQARTALGDACRTPWRR